VLLGDLLLSKACVGLSNLNQCKVAELMSKAISEQVEGDMACYDRELALSVAEPNNSCLSFANYTKQVLLFSSAASFLRYRGSVDKL